MRDDPRRARSIVGLLALASITILTLDARHGSGGSPVDPLRSAVGAALGPVEERTAQAFEPLTDLTNHFGRVRALREQNAVLQQANDELTRDLRVSAANTSRDREVSGIARLADTSAFDVVQAQVIAVGPAQSFSRTVTIDAGSSSGVVPDLTVINADGLVGRVIAAGRSTATVLLIIDAKSTVGGRLGESMELGFLAGDGAISDDSSLDLSLVDHTVAPRTGDVVLTWGSRDGAPYVAGVPIGTVTGVRTSPAELTQTARIQPFADFSALDVVGVVTASSGRRQQLAGGER